MMKFVQVIRCIEDTNRFEKCSECKDDFALQELLIIAQAYVITEIRNANKEITRQLD